MIFLSQPIPDAGRKLPANLVRSSKWSGHSPFKAVMRGSSPARITLRLMDRTPASQAGNMGSTPLGITKVFKWNCSSRVECGPGKPRDAGSSPASSTIHEKSELTPDRECVRISYFHQRHYILSLCPRFCLAHNRGFGIFDIPVILRYNDSIKTKED